MLDIKNQTTPSFDLPSLGQDLDQIDIGWFLLNHEGYMVANNEVAAALLGVSPEHTWEERHISRIDELLATGLKDFYEPLFDNGDTFVRRNLAASNRLGNFVELNLICRSLSADDGQRYLVGLVEDVCHEGSRYGSNQPFADELQILSEVAAALSSSNELDEILGVILTGATASQGLGFNRAFLFLFDESQNLLKGHLAIGPSSPEEAGNIWQNLEKQHLSLSDILDRRKTSFEPQRATINDLVRGITVDLNIDSLISKCCQRQAWTNLEEINNLDAATSGVLSRLGTKRAAIVPMVSKGRLRGLLAADNQITGRAISDNAVQMLQILANQGAVAMERARLYNVLQERADQLEKMNALIAESQEHIIKIEKMSLIGELTASIAHELRNPLTIVGGFANLTLKSALTDEQREYLNIIACETKRVEAVLNHVLDFSRASRGNQQPLDLHRLIDQTLNLMLGRVHRTGVSMTLKPTDNAIPIYGNYDQLSHAFYQFFKLVAEEIIPPGKAEISAEICDDRAVTNINLLVDPEHRDKTSGAVKRIFTSNKASQRLTILVAGETVKFHGGTFGFAFSSEQNLLIYIELPIFKEVTRGSTTDYNR